MPIEDFGAAMLRGMGWEEGKPVGRNSKGLAAAVEFVPRGGRLGLGADAPAREKAPKKFIKPGESREKPAEMVLAAGPEGKSRNVKSLDEKLVKREAPGAREGKSMYVIEGRHRGLLGRVLRLVQQEGRSERAQVELSSSGEVVTIRSAELADLGTREANTAQGKGKDRSRDGGGVGGGSGVGVGQKRERGEQRAGEGETNMQKKERTSDKEETKAWLYGGIRVRIVSKSFQGGRLYLKKAMVVDVLSPRECVLELEGGEVLSHVSQRVLETALPKRGGRVMVLNGQFRGQRGKLLDKKGEAASVQLIEDFSLHNFKLDEIAEYTGDEVD
jgi:G patch domain/KOW motif-containing protein